MKKIVRGNDFTLRIPVRKMVNGEQVAFPLPACTDIQVNIVNQYRRVSLAYSIDTAEDNIILARVEGDAVSVGTYALEVRGKIFGNDWRSKEYEQFAIVDNNASGDTEFNGELIEGEDSVEMNTALVVLPPTAELTQLINDTNAALETAKQTDATLKFNESERAKAEAMRELAEISRDSEEDKRSENEKARQAAEAERVSNEEARKAAETERVKADKERAANVATATSSCTSAAKAANDAASTAKAAGEKATAMAAEAENINVTLGGSVISVTNRKGETKTVDVVNTDETVNVTITSSVSSIKVSGVKINVFINNGKTPQTYTTNSEGKVSFVVNRGNYYQITFTEYGNAQPIAPVGFTAVLATRNIDVEYKPYDEESMENVVVTVTKYTDGTTAAYEGVPVSIVYDGKDIGGTTDADGKVSVFIPYNKEYIVNVDNVNGYYIRSNKNKRVYTARLPQRDISYTMYPFKTGIFILDATGAEYTLEEWQATGKMSDEAIAIKFANLDLILNNSVFCLRTKDLKNIGSYGSYSWCSSNVVFESIPANGLDNSSDSYWNGELNTFLIMQEADEKSLLASAFHIAQSETIKIGENTLNGFILTVGQELVHIANRDIVRDILSALYGSSVGSDYYSKSGSFNYRRLTSCQYKTEACSVYIVIDVSVKTQPKIVLPAFAG